MCNAVVCEPVYRVGNDKCCGLWLQDAHHCPIKSSNPNTNQCWHTSSSETIKNYVMLQIHETSLNLQISGFFGPEYCCIWFALPDLCLLWCIWSNVYPATPQLPCVHTQQWEWMLCIHSHVLRRWQMTHSRQKNIQLLLFWLEPGPLLPMNHMAIGLMHNILPSSSPLHGQSPKSSPDQVVTLQPSTSFPPLRVRHRPIHITSNPDLCDC